MPMSEDTQKIVSSAAGGAAGSVMSGAMGLVGDAIQYKRQKELIQSQRDYEQAVLRSQREYNSPAAQVQRLKDAGLNPALMYGGSANTGNVDDAPMQQPSSPPPTGSILNSAMSNALNSQLIKSQTRLNDAKAAETETKTEFDKESFDVRLQQLFTSLGLSEKQIEEFGHRWNVMDAQTEYYLAKKGFTDQLTNTEFWQSKIAKNQWKTTYNESVWSGDYFQNVVKLQVADMGLKELQSKKMTIEINNLGNFLAAQINHLNSQAGLFSFQSQLAELDLNSKKRKPGAPASNKLEEDFDLQLKLTRSNLRNMSQTMFTTWMRYKMDEHMFYWKGKEAYSEFLTKTYGTSFLGKHFMDGFNAGNSKIDEVDKQYLNLFKSFSDISNAFYETMPALEFGK